MHRWMQAMVPSDLDDDATPAKAAAAPSSAPPGRPPQVAAAADAKLKEAAAAAAAAALGRGFSGEAGNDDGHGGPKDFFVALQGQDIMGSDALMMKVTSLEEVKRTCRSRGCSVFVVSVGMAFVKSGSLELMAKASEQPGATIYLDVGSQWLGRWHKPWSLEPEFRIVEEPGSMSLRLEVSADNGKGAYAMRVAGMDEAEVVGTSGYEVRLQVHGDGMVRKILPPGQSEPIEEVFMRTQDFSGAWGGPEGLVVVEQAANRVAKVLLFGPDGGLAEVYSARAYGKVLEFEGPRATMCYGSIDQLGQTIKWYYSGAVAGELPLIGQEWGRVEAGFRAYGAKEPRLPAPHAMQMQADDLAACKHACVERGYGGFSVADGHALFRGEPADAVLPSLQPAEPWRTSFVRLSAGEEATLKEVWRSAGEVREEASAALEAERTAWACKSEGWSSAAEEQKVLEAKAKRRALRDVEASWTGAPAASFRVSLLDPAGAGTRRLAVHFVDALQRIYLALLPVFSGTGQTEPVVAFWQTTCFCIDLLASFACFYFRNEAAGLFQSSIDLLLEVLHVTRWASVGKLLAGDAAGMAEGALQSVVLGLVACLREAWEQKLASDDGKEQEEEKAAERRLELLAAHAQYGQPPLLPRVGEVEFCSFGRGRGTRLLQELVAAASRDPERLLRFHLLARSCEEPRLLPSRAALATGRRGIFGCFYDVLERYGFAPDTEGVRDLARHVDRWARGDTTVQFVAFQLGVLISIGLSPAHLAALEAAAAAGGAPADAAGGPPDDAAEGELQGKYTHDRDDYTANIKDFGRYRVFVRAAAPRGAGFHVCLCTHSEVGHMTPTFRIARALAARSAIGRVTFATNMFGARKVAKWLRDEPDATGKLQLVGYEDGWSQEMQDASNAMAQSGDGSIVMTVAAYAELGILPFLESLAEEQGGREANEPDCWVLDIMATMGALKGITQHFASKKPVLVSAPLPILASFIFEAMQSLVLVHCFTLLPEDVGGAFGAFGSPPANVLPVGMFAGGPGQDLPEELLAFIERPGPPVVYVSMGSQGALTKEQLLEVSRGLAAPGEWRVIWSLRDNQQSELPGGGPAGLGPDFLVRSWLPQADILRHPRVAAFVSHCGWGATSEAILSATPVVAMPLFADQPINAVMMSLMGMARTLFGCLDQQVRKDPGQFLASIFGDDDFFGYLETLKADDFRTAIRDVLTDERYKKAADAALLHAALHGDGAARTALEVERRCGQPAVAVAAAATAA